MSVSYVYKVKKGIHKVIYDKLYFNCSSFRKMHYEKSRCHPVPPVLDRKNMAPGTEDDSDQLIAESSSPRSDSAEQQSGSEQAAAADCKIKCANCDAIFSPDKFDEHVCEYDERKKRIEPGSVLDEHPCFRQIEQNMEQWKRLTKKKGRVTAAAGPGGDADETKDKRKRKGVVEKDRHRCGHCERTFVHASGLEKHLAKVHPEVGGGEKGKDRDKDPTESFKICLKCTKCGMIFGSLDKMMEHLEMVDWERELEQEGGSYMDNGKVCLRKAFRIVILTSVYQCEFCDKHFSDFPSLYQHESLHDPTSGYECSLCEIRIPCMKDMLFHRLNECVFRDAWNDEFRNLPKYFACNVCDDQFESLGALYEHRYGNYHLFPRPSKMEENESSSDQLKVGCEVCGTSFDNADSLFSHYTDVHCKKKSGTFGIRRQPAEKPDSTTTTTTTTSPPCSSTRPYLCELCGKTYTQSSHLWQHLRFHNGVRPFTCPEAGCNRSFTIRPDLKDHIRKCHTGERPYHCTLCDKRFLTGSVYYQHRLIHRGERRYGCEECGKRFYRADALKNHQRIHSGEKPFACPHCPKQFRQRGDREKHIRVKHSGPSKNQESSLAYQGTPLTSRSRSKRQQQQKRRGGPKRLSQQVEPPEEPTVVEQVVDGSQEVPDAYDYSYSGNHSYHQQHPPPDGSSGNSCSDAVMIKIDVPPPAPSEPRFPKEIWKTFVALLMLVFNFILATVSLAMVHDRVPNRDTYGPLPDVVLDNTQPVEWALDVSEVLIMVVVNSCVLLITFHKHRFIVMRRIFLLMALLYFMRSITMYVTVLPMSNTSYYCSPKSNSTTPMEIMRRAFQLISGFGLSINGKHTYCGDYIYSGHTVTLVLGYLIIAEYSPKKFWIIHWLAWCASLTGVTMVLLAHGHYTVDVLIAYYVTTRLFWTYHTLANNSLLLKQNGHNYIGREWWFFIFRYFEKNVRGPVPLQYDCPLPIPWMKKAPKLPSRES